MKFTTPELFVRLNQAGDADIDAVHDEWDAALANARAAYLKVRATLPVKLQEFHERLCLHDAQFIEMIQSSGSAIVPVCVLIVRQDDKMISLVYSLLDEPTIETPIKSDVFDQASDEPLWLYDELDVAGNGGYLHEILLSDGRQITLRFFQFDYFVYHSRTPAGALQAAST